MSERTHGLTADLQRFFVPVDLDRRRVLAFDNRATWLVYQRYGAGFWRELYEPDPDKPKQFRLRSLEALEFFLWAGLQRDADAAGEILRLEDIGALILPQTISDLAQALLIALSATHRRPEKESKND